MSEEILINVSPRETRVAIVENGVLQEMLVERASKRGLVGNIYMGTVVRVLPGMQAAFVEMGLERAAFLHASDMLSVSDEYLQPTEITEPQESISDLLRDGQNIAVQVIKDPIGTKGARLTTRISLPSRYLVFMPGISHVGVSQRIEEEEERERLKKIVEEGLSPNQGGYIIRTAAEGTTAAEIKDNQEYLIKLWGSISRKMQKAKSGDIIHEDLPLFLRSLRDYVSIQTERVRIDDKEAYERSLTFIKEFVPTMTGKVEFYTGERPLFDLYGIEDEIQRALHRKVQLKSGGHLIFDQTEAMTTIDVNTGAFVGHRNLEETIFKTNLEAAVTIARQLRVRNLGGIIIIDFIDMTNEEHKRQVLRALEKALARDHTKNSISEVSSLGLVEMTRKRTRESLEHVLCETCSVCAGRGTIKTTETVCNEIFREVLRAARAYDTKSYLVLASQEVVDRMLDEESASVGQLEVQIGKQIKFQVESLYTQEQFDVVLM
ncbi:MAG: ribonuclease E/G [Gammaproteobacteria bacterium 39-13]|nr:ribonuclease G [Gammaproteobacteria bacterium]OJV89829.1 MAG: ribonuclease E/G [Gammaproteobacteria bacterium 39-13]